jgi:hypothetical protein
MREGRFGIPGDHVVVTTTYVTEHGRPVLLVSHEMDDDGTPCWQFHADNGDYSTAVLQLVALDQIRQLDASLDELATLPVAHEARRASPAHAWVITPIVEVPQP